MDKKLWYIDTMEYYAALKIKDILSMETAWKDPERIVLSKIRQSEKNEYHMISLIGRI